mmetsp:Transcript_4608/g.16132  ORF Transcript_4608/g.16132 Transcript_4608/m.16132 type:complete len:202 (+) Transcript_4608:576-1181(+)
MFVRRRAPFVSQPARPSSPGGACDDPIHPPLEGLALDLLARSVERVGHGVDVSRVQTLKDLPNAGLLDLIEGVRHQNQLHLGACEVPVNLVVLRWVQQPEVRILVVRFLLKGVERAVKNVVELDGVLLHPGHHVVAPVGLHEERVVLRPHDGHAGEHREPRPFSVRRTDSLTLADSCGTGSLERKKRKSGGQRPRLAAVHS